MACGLQASGVRRGQRIAMLVPPGIDFVALVFALFKAQAVVILIDPGIGKSNLVRCLAEAEPDGFVGIPRAQLARWLFRKRFPAARQNFVAGHRWWPGCRSIETFRPAPESTCGRSAGLPRGMPAVRHAAEEPAAIIFTSGSTGPPKGVGYSHCNFITQAMEIRDYFGIRPGGADVSGFPLFALFNAAMGKTTVFPKMDFTRPADVSPELFLAAAEDWQADQAFGSPALWNTVSRWCREHGRKLPSIRRALSAGAPVPAHVLQRVKKIIAEDGDVYTPYGATEALPVACNSASVVLGETAVETSRGRGVCVGSRFPNIRWKVIRIRDDAIETIDQAEELPEGEIGELVVAGPVVTERYVTRTAANRLAKIRDDGFFWHRMGDVGYLDSQQRFWFCGRKSQRVMTHNTTLFTVPCESIINTHPAIYRSALVGVGPRGCQSPVIVAEPWPEHWPATPARKQRLIRELYGLAGQHSLTRAIESIRLIRRLPVDIRHNSKIFREQLARAIAHKGPFRQQSPTVDSGHPGDGSAPCKS
jgi:acyl-CoA synthetase (AMP-forming)/AMP-acid ligase II